MISMGEPIYGFVTKGDGKALKAQIVGVDVAENRMVILYEDGNEMYLADDVPFYTQRFAAECATVE
ncbi:hypothetical protein IVA98_28985 [Bradyrhizobium sp. 160]|uniref:hypothetical protein n=1 Tax=Bradyrhizobium sp. 160 TaxID=2782634 RepID=UPI001FFAC7E3|nr:hypothetical protein [Bradyrhizobium sp. 160]MCK1627091.1 hypothetical protein [Bradyrhizobium sp. 160]